ncbi:MAG TPA: ester cyclase [Bryobacteraceae bacterium]|jgi:steroid delta-isomerase-like uncharacterized protein|nr:ester cyclase [Bryobacteraceae bacterium]
MAQNPVQIAQRYFEAWNQHDAGAIMATFAEGGTYADPATRGPLTGAVIGAYAQALWDAFPDLSFEIVSVTENASGLVSAEWLMKGANTGPFNGLPPTGATVALSGADFVRVAADKIQSVQGYFDSGALPRALGLDVIVQPKAVGPFGFGTSTRVSTGNTATPGAFSITWLEARTDEERQQVRESARKIALEMLAMPGFISWVGATIGDRMMTITAWETADAMTPLMKGGEHRSAVGRFFSPELSRGAATGVWIPARLNPRWIRCTACSKMVDSEKTGGKCGCGAALPGPLAYW